MLVRSIVLVALTAALVPACSSSSDSGGSAAPTNVPFDQLPGMVAQAECNLLTQCYGSAAPLLFGADDCLTRETKTLASSGFAVEPMLIASGKLTYDGTQVQACIAALTAAGCTTNSTPDACKKVLVGTTATGGSCTEDAECANDGICVGHGTCPGACTARVALGASCMRDQECVEGAACATGVCVTPSAAGQSCGMGSGQCSPGLFCAGGTATMPGTCKTIDEVFSAALGATCDAGASVLCAPGAFCAAASVSGGKLTYQCVGPSTAGGACKVSFPDSCPAGQFCNADTSTGKLDGTCDALPADGAPCGGAGASKCKSGSACSSGTCRPLQDVGGTCATGAECYSNVCTSGACVAGSSCTDN